MMNISILRIPDVKVFTSPKYSDNRGWFSESYNQKHFVESGIDVKFLQDNHSYSSNVGTVRGLHYQSPPYAQDKLVRVLRGAILDVAVDFRNGSPTKGQWVSAELSAMNGSQLFVPVGFLHGFITLEPDTEVAYKVSDFYSKECEGSVRWNDNDLGIDWGEYSEMAALSDKDAVAPFYKDVTSPFQY